MMLAKLVYLVTAPVLVAEVPVGLENIRLLEIDFVGRTVLTERNGGRHEDAVPPDDRRRVAQAGNRDLPADVLGLAPLDRRLAVGRDPRAQHGVTVDQDLKRAPQGGHVERAGQAEGACDVVQRSAGVELVLEPEGALTA